MNKDMKRLCEIAKGASISPFAMEDRCAEAVVKAVLEELRTTFDAKAAHGTIHATQVSRYAGVAIELILQD